MTTSKATEHLQISHLGLMIGIMVIVRASIAVIACVKVISRNLGIKESVGELRIFNT